MNNLRETLGSNALLGKTTNYPSNYDKNLLFPVERNKQRTAMGFEPTMKFHGVDVWNMYEVAFLNNKSKPVRLALSMYLDANSKFLPESKSVKLYFNSFNNEKFNSVNDFLNIVQKDISEICNTNIKIVVNSSNINFDNYAVNNYTCIDDLDIDISDYKKNADLLKNSSELVSEKLVSHLFKSHCLCTGQPDWGSIFIEYQGQKLCHEGLLAYLVSFYNHVGFSENCIEQIFVDLNSRFKFEYLTVFGRFLRRGGIDINPYRSSSSKEINDIRLLWQ